MLYAPQFLLEAQINSDIVTNRSKTLEKFGPLQDSFSNEKWPGERCKMGYDSIGTSRRGGLRTIDSILRKAMRREE